MKMKDATLLFAMLMLASTASAQLEKTIHQTFPLEDKASINLDLYGEYTLVPWAGNNVLIETRVELYNSTPSILKHFVEKELRYQIDMDSTNSGILKLSSHDKKRISIRNKTGTESTEIITTKVFVPDNFIVIDEKTLVLDKEKK